MSHKILRTLAAGALSVGALSYGIVGFAAPAPDPLPGRPTPSTTQTVPVPGVPIVPETATDRGNVPAPRQVAPTSTKGDSANFALTNKESSVAKKTLADLHKVNALEIELGKLAQDSGSSDTVKGFGKQLIDDHQAADQKIVEFAQSHNIVLSAELPARRDNARPANGQRGVAGAETPTADAINGNPVTANKPGSVAGEAKTASDAPPIAPQLDAEGQRTLAKLQKLTGPKFDKAFVTTMVQGHTKTLAKVKAAEGKIDNAELKSILEDVQTTVTKHLDHAKELQRGGTASTDSANPVRSASAE